MGVRCGAPGVCGWQGGREAGRFTDSLTGIARVVMEECGQVELPAQSATDVGTGEVQDHLGMPPHIRRYRTPEDNTRHTHTHTYIYIYTPRTTRQTDTQRWLLPQTHSVLAARSFLPGSERLAK